MKTLTTTDLDAKLTALAADPDRFAAGAKALARQWNEQGIDIDLPSPESWRRPHDLIPGAVASIEEQLRAEIDALPPMEREQVAAHARRIEWWAHARPRRC